MNQIRHIETNSMEMQFQLKKLNPMEAQRLKRMLKIMKIIKLNVLCNL